MFGIILGAFAFFFVAKSGICSQDEKKKMTRSGSPMTGSSASESVVVSTCTNHLVIKHSQI